MVNYEKMIRRIKKSENIFIMGHKNIDFDSLGACLAVNNICEYFNKKSYIVLEDSKFDGGIKKALKYIDENLKVNIGKFADLKSRVNKNSLMVIVDTFNESRSQSPKFCLMFENVIFIDHHLFGKAINENYYIDSKVSSVCEMLAYLFEKRRMKLNKYIATIMLAGIDIDSNNYSMKTTYRTHNAVSFLLKSGAELMVSTDFTRTKIEDYIKIQKIIFKTEFYKKKYAIVLCEKDVIYERKSLAIISDNLLMFSNVEASFAIGFLDKDLIGISARSVEMDVAQIMQDLGGGGSKNNAACQIEGTNLKEIEKLVKEKL